MHSSASSWLWWYRVSIKEINRVLRYLLEKGTKEGHFYRAIEGEAMRSRA
jgi:hypothetical protein